MKPTFRQYLNISEGLKYHIENDLPLCENVFRYGSEQFFELFKEARRLLNDGQLSVLELDRHLLEQTDIGELAEYEGVLVPLDCPFECLIEAEYHGKTVELNEPHRGGNKKYYVYVKDPQTGNVKKISFGAQGMSVGINDPERRKSFAARHRCSEQKDKLSAAYWSCNLPRYAKQLGLTGGGQFYW